MLEFIPTGYLFFCMVLISMLFGSFLNVLITRLPLMIDKEYRLDCYEFLEMDVPDDIKQKELNLFFPNSHCFKCKKDINFYYNIPILSYILLKGKCRYCNFNIPIRYFIVEVLTPILSIFVFLRFGITDNTCYALLFTWGLIALSFIDFENTILPDQLTLSLMWFGIFVNLSDNFVTISSSILGVIAGYLSLWMMYWGFKLITKKEGLGYGDFKLLAMLGAWVGVMHLPLIIFMSAALGCLVSIPWLLINKKDKDTPIPFGPFLSLAGYVTFLYDDIIQFWYIKFLGVVL